MCPVASSPQRAPPPFPKKRIETLEDAVSRARAFLSNTAGIFFVKLYSAKKEGDKWIITFEETLGALEKVTVTVDVEGNIVGFEKKP